MPLTTQAGGGGPTGSEVGGGSGGTGGGGGSGGSGSSPGESNPPGTGGDGTNPGGTPIINKPDVPNDNPPANGDTPNQPGSTTPDDDLSHGRPVPTDVNIDLPTNDEGEPDPTLNLPWVDDTTDGPTDLPETPDVPKFPTDEKTHSVPDHGSTIALIMAAFAGLAAFRRQAKLR